MSREEAYNMLIKRIELPENRERYTECALRPNKENGDYLIHFFIFHVFHSFLYNKLSRADGLPSVKRGAWGSPHIHNFKNKSVYF